MKRKTQRMVFVIAGLAILGVATLLVVYALGDNLRFFMSPSDVEAADEQPTGTFRMGGLVVEGSLERLPDQQIRFSITDGLADKIINYDQQDHGNLPDLFREGQGVVVEGELDADGTFVAERVLAKHDENYMPREVADALKKSGHWEDQYGAEAESKKGNGAEGQGYGTSAP